jgi:hypothetical protein
MQDLQQIVEATWDSSRQVMQESKLVAKVGGLSNIAFLR